MYVVYKNLTSIKYIDLKWNENLCVTLTRKPKNTNHPILSWYLKVTTHHDLVFCISFLISQLWLTIYKYISIYTSKKVLLRSRVFSLSNYNNNNTILREMDFTEKFCSSNVDAKFRHFILKNVIHGIIDSSSYYCRRYWWVVGGYYLLLQLGWY